MPRLPREPGLRQLRPVDGQLPHHLDGAGDQLRDVPQPGGTRAGGPGDPEGEPLKDVKLIVTKKFTVEQHNSNCGPCHAKMSPVSAVFTPGSGTSTISTSRPLRTRTSPGRPGPGGELHVHALADEPVREVGETQLHALPHLQRPVRFKKPEDADKRVFHATRSGWKRRRAQPSPREARRAAAFVPHAHDRVRPDAAQRPLHAAAHAGATIAWKSPTPATCATRTGRRVADNLVRACVRGITSAGAPDGGLVDAARKGE